MKNKFSIIELLCCIAIIALLAVAALPSAFAQVEAFSTRVLTLSSNAVTSNATATITTPAIEVRGGEGVGFLARFALAGAGTGNVTYRFDVSHDGTTWTTAQPFTAAVAANGTNAVTGFFAFTPTGTPPLRNVQYLRLSQVTNGNPANATLQELRATWFNR